MSGLNQQVDSPLVVGRVGGVHGIKGWLKINSYTRPSENILTYKPWLLAKNNIWQEINIEESQVHTQKLLVKILGVDNPEVAAEYVNCEVAIKPEQLPKLNQDQYYWRDLIGLDVFNRENILLGVVSEIIETGANDVFVVTGGIDGESRVLIPFIMNLYVNNIDLSNQIIHVDWVVEK